MTTIGERLRDERKRLELSQEALAIACGVTKNTQLNYERGIRSPDAAYLARAASAGVDVLFVLVASRTDSSLAMGWPEGTHPFADLTVEESILLRNYRATDDEGRAEVLGASAVQVDRAERRAQKSPPPAKT